MEPLSQRLANLSPEQRASLEPWLQEKPTLTDPDQAVPQRAPSVPPPLSFAQQRLWLLGQLEPNSPLSNLPEPAVRLRGRLGVGAVHHALDAIVARHEALRTTLTTVTGNPVLVIQEPRPVELAVIDLRAWPEAEREAEAHRVLDREARRPFDLSRDVMLRATLLRLGTEEHVLLLVTHQIASDDWSTGVLHREFAALYTAFTTGGTASLPDLPVQYADYALWQRQWLQGGRLETPLAYWAQQLAGAPPVLELPTDRPRPPVQTCRGARHALALAPAVTEALKAVSRQEGVTLFMTLLAAFQTLLHRYTRQDDFVVGSPMAGRIRPELEGLIGLFANTLPLRADLSGDPTFRDLLGRVREVALGAYAHQELPFEKLVELLQPERSLSRSPLYRVLFTFQHFPNPLELPGLALSPFDVHTGMAKCEVSLELRQGAEDVRGWFEYNTDLFDATTVGRMAEHWRTLLEGIVTNPDQRLAALPLLTEAERQQLLVEWNHTSREYPREVCLHQLFEAQVDRSPEAMALVFHSEHLTYRELNRRANQVAHYLRKQGVGPEVCVGVFMERSLEMLIGIYGILKAGGTYVPLDPEYPPDRVAFMLQDAQVPVLLTQKRLVPQLPGHHAQVVCLDADWAIMAQESTDNPRSGATATNVAYVLYTSGSTGKPKGVLNTHRGICNRLLWMQEAYQLTEADRVLHKTPFSFDVSVWELFWPLLVGSRLIVAQPGGHRDNAYLVHLIVTHGITTLHFVPSMLQLFLEEPDVGRCQRLRRVICSGEALPYELQARFFARLPTVELHNLYGPTEAAIDVTSWACQPQSMLSIVPIGRPVANTQLYILDPHLQPVPIRVPGELHIGGVQVARGYLSRPELTAEKFIPDPFSTTPGARLYKTGDLARYGPDGTIEFLGRLDHQVKLRGFRIELGEIEAMLGQHPAVRETVVTVREDSPGDKRLVAYIVPHRGCNPSTSALQHFLRERLPAYMVPAVLVPLQAMPLTPNGKVDRRALPALGPSRPELEQAYVAPQTRLEQFLARLWCEVLQLDRVGIHDNFFDLGGNSIQGAIVINKLQQRLQDPLYIVALFDAPTVAAFAAFLTTNYGDAVARLLGPEAHPHHLPPQGAAAPARERRVEAAMLDQMRQLIVPLAPRAHDEEGPREKNPQVIFVLAPFRSGTTLLRVMLAGHPRLFAPAELHLLGFNTLGERRAAFSGKYSLWLEGTIRAVMQIQGCDADHAKRILARYEDQDMTTKQFYRVLQDWIAPQTLVDKSPLYALDLATLKRAEDDFKDAFYIHLVRHPYAMVRSFERYRLEQVLCMPEQPFSARELGELVWVISHQNIVAFLEGIPERRKYRMRFEELTQQPQAVMEQMCQKFGLEYHPDLIEPYKDQEKKMTDGIYAVSAPMGDTKFNEYQSIDPKVAAGWKEVMRDNFLGEVTWEWAEQLGYERVGRQAELDEWRLLRARRHTGSAHGPEARTGRASAETGASGNGMLRTGHEGDARTMVDRPDPGDGGAKSAPLSFAQERLWFLDQLTPGTAAYNLPTAVRLCGELNRAALEASLDEIVRRHEVLRTCFVAVEGKPVQMMAPSARLAVTVIDLGPMPEAECAVEVQRLASEEARRPFNLAQGPLVRATLLRLSDQEHVLLLTLHHIVSDAWSRGVFNHELTALYDAFAAGRPSPLPALPVQYADYVVWQREWLRGAVLEHQLQYWRRQLAGVPVLELPFDYPRPAVETYRGARAAFRLPKQLRARLTALSRQEGVTLYMTLLAAFQTLLARYTGQDDIAVGSPIAGRNRAEFEGLIGFFVNTLVIRSDLSGDPTFRELLGRVREVALGAYTHQELPFERLVEELAPARSLSHSPLFQVMFVLQNAPQQTLELTAVSLEPMEVDSGASKFDLTLFMNEGTEGLSGQLEYDTDLFEAGTIRRMLGHWEVLLEGIAADPDRRLSELPLLPEAERRQLLVDWNRTGAAYPRACLHELFERQAAGTPGAVALLDEGERLTYAELNARANQLAHYLQRRGVGPEVPVGICVERSLEVVVGLLGILKAGGAYVPLDPAYPAPHLAFMLEDAAVQYVLTQERLRASLPWRGAEVVCLDADRALFAQESDQDLGLPLTPEHAAYVMYTSGSTGTPKGVVGLHRGTLNRCQWMWQQYPFAPHEVCCQKTALSFVDSVWEIFGPLLRGIPLLLVREHVVKDPVQLVLQLAAHHVTRITLVPALLRAILDVLAQAQERLPALKFWVSSGEALLPDLAQRFSALLPHAVLVNLYGSSEVAADVAWYEVGPIDRRAPSMPIGRPIANTQVYVLDPHLHPVPVGVSGELYVGGANVARGYLNRPALTAERFVPDPFGPEPGERLYRTGDLARSRPDGTLEYLGRIDHQVKVRGHRIELGEVEAVLRAQAGVRQAVVVAREEMPGDKRLVAYVVPAQAPGPAVRELRDSVTAQLPDYMVPSAFVLLDALPLTPNGKVDRRALPAPEGVRPELEAAYVAPRTPLEEAVAGIWSEVLGLKRVSIDDNFFEVGGHSLSAIRVISRLRDAFHIELPLRAFFEAPTVAGQAWAITQRQAAQIEHDELARMLAELEALSN
jgi:amino acid adenylation domain-containing protein